MLQVLDQHRDRRGVVGIHRELTLVEREDEFLLGIVVVGFTINVAHNYLEPLTKPNCVSYLDKAGDKLLYQDCNKDN